MRQITTDQLDDIALGAAVLGTGGGGDPYVGKLMAQAAIARHGPVTLLEAGDLDDGDLVIPGGMMGAPTVMLEKVPAGREIGTVIRALAAYLGRPVAATMSPEAGGINSTIPIAAAAELGLPLVDADMVGRAFPELQMCTPTLYGVPATPLAVADDKGNSAIVTATDNRWAERLARSLTVDMGCWAMVALYPMTGRQVKETCIHGTITLLARIGCTIRAARARHEDPVAAVCAVTKGRVIWRGKVVDVARRTAGGFVRGEAAIAGVEADAGRTLRIAFQNEFLLARAGDEVLATTPDLITVLDAETGEPITTETLRYGHRVVVLRLPGDPRWRSPAGLRVVGPEYFGYDVPYRPAEQRAVAGVGSN